MPWPGFDTLWHLRELSLAAKPRLADNGRQGKLTCPARVGGA